MNYLAASGGGISEGCLSNFAPRDWNMTHQIPRLRSGSPPDHLYGLPNGRQGRAGVRLNNFSSLPFLKL